METQSAPTGQVTTDNNQVSSEMSIFNQFASLQRAVVTLEIGYAIQNQQMQVESIKLINEFLPLVLTSINQQTLNTMGKKGNNHTVRPAPDGTKQPKNNQGVPPSPAGGSTGGRKKK